MKYTKEITDRLVEDYNNNIAVSELAAQLRVPERSIVAKLASLGIYHKKQYLNKRGEVPKKKSEYIDNIATLLSMNTELLESLEKVNKSVLIALEQELTRCKVELGEFDPKP